MEDGNTWSLANVQRSVPYRLFISSARYTRTFQELEKRISENERRLRVLELSRTGGERMSVGQVMTNLERMLCVHVVGSPRNAKKAKLLTIADLQRHPTYSELLPDWLQGEVVATIQFYRKCGDHLLQALSRDELERWIMESDEEDEHQVKQCLLDGMESLFALHNLPFGINPYDN